MLFGISIIFGITGNTNLFLINAFLQAEQLGGFTFIFAGILVLSVIGFKVSIAPFHFWTPDVYEGAPITITAFLSVASKAAGFALLIRFIKITFFESTTADGYWQLLNVIDWQSILVMLAILTMSIGNFTALWQDNLKRMLAYSSIAQFLGETGWTTEEEFRSVEERIVENILWLEENPFATDANDTKAISQYVLDWLTETPYISVTLDQIFTDKISNNKSKQV